MWAFRWMTLLVHAPYYWEWPSISMPDFDHHTRTSRRHVKPSEKFGVKYKNIGHILYITIDHLRLLHHKLKEKEAPLRHGACPFTLDDLLFDPFQDQKSDAANRIFSFHTYDMLAKCTSHDTAATQLFILGTVYLLTHAVNTHLALLGR